MLRFKRGRKREGDRVSEGKVFVQPLDNSAVVCHDERV